MYKSGHIRRFPQKMEWRRDHDAVYWFDLKIAQHRGLVFWQSMLHVIILNDSMSAECLLKVVHKTSEVFVPQDPIRAASRPKVTVRPNFAKDFSGQSSGTTESDTLQSVSCAKNSLHIFKLGTGRLVANGKTGSSDRRTIPGRAPGRSPSRPRSKERTGSPMLSGFFANHPDKNQLLKELHNNSNEDYTFLNSSARKLSKHRRMWKASSYANCPERFKVGIACKKPLHTYVADAERNFLKLRKILKSASK